MKCHIGLHTRQAKFSLYHLATHEACTSAIWGEIRAYECIKQLDELSSTTRKKNKLNPSSSYPCIVFQKNLTISVYLRNY
jgi:hypothetical protein